MCVVFLDAAGENTYMERPVGVPVIDFTLSSAQPRRKNLLSFRYPLSRWTVPVWAAVAGLAICGGSLQAQQASHSIANLNFGSADHSPHTDQERTVQGLVQDKNGAPVKGAMVYLKNSRDSSVDIVIADANGSYRFGPLAADRDYEIWAQDGKMRSASRPISSFSTGPLTMSLVIGAANPAASNGASQKGPAKL